MTTQVVRYAERPELWKNAARVTREVWPEYNLHSDEPNGYWEQLFEAFPGFQFVLYDDEQDEVSAEGHTLPCDWDGTVDGLGEGIDTTIASAFRSHRDGRAPTAPCALAAEIRPRSRAVGWPSGCST
jgi:hypothetical protein